MIQRFRYKVLRNKDKYALWLSSDNFQTVWMAKQYDREPCRNAIISDIRLINNAWGFMANHGSYYLNCFATADIEEYE